MIGETDIAFSAEMIALDIDTTLKLISISLLVLTIVGLSIRDLTSPWRRRRE